jgi:hypothetical protein
VVQFLAIALLFLGLIIPAIWLARINIRRGRGDRRGAARLAFLVFIVTLVSWVFGADHNATPDAFEALIVYAIPQSMLAGGLVWLIYMALEPYIRRRWPETIVSWTQALGGDLRNALVGRDVLIGVAVGISSCVLSLSDNAIRSNIGSTPNQTSYINSLLDTRRFIASGVLGPIKGAVIISLFLFLLVCLIRLVTRRRWLAGAVYVCIFTLMQVLVSTDLRITVPICLVNFTMTAVLMLRFGLLAMVTCAFVGFVLGFTHISTDISAWYSGCMMAGVGVVVALAAFAFHQSLGGQKLFHGSLLDD